MKRHGLLPVARSTPAKRRPKTRKRPVEKNSTDHPSRSHPYEAIVLTIIYIALYCAFVYFMN